MGNKWVGNKWKIWGPTGAAGPEKNSEVPTWHALTSPSTPPALAEGGWWRLKMRINYDADRYVSLELTSPSGVEEAVDLSSWRIAAEARQWNEPSLFVALESENLWAEGDTAVWEHKQFYDALNVTQVDAEAARRVLDVTPPLNLAPRVIAPGGRTKV